MFYVATKPSASDPQMFPSDPPMLVRPSVRGERVSSIGEFIKVEEIMVGDIGMQIALFHNGHFFSITANAATYLHALETSQQTHGSQSAAAQFKIEILKNPHFQSVACSVFLSVESWLGIIGANYESWMLNNHMRTLWHLGLSSKIGS